MEGGRSHTYGSSIPIMMVMMMVMVVMVLMVMMVMMIMVMMMSCCTSSQNGMKAIDVAREQGHTDIVAILAQCTENNACSYNYVQSYYVMLSV